MNNNSKIKTDIEFSELLLMQIVILENEHKFSELKNWSGFKEVISRFEK